MNTLRHDLRLVAGAAMLWLGAGAGLYADSATALYRIFLSDGGSLISFGRFARVGQDVVFSLPLGLEGEPRLQLVSIPEQVVNWAATDQYASSVEYANYVATRGEADFSRMTDDVALALNEIALTEDPLKRLAIARSARQILLAWPERNFGYRMQDVRQIVALLDEIVSELRVAAGEQSFDLSLMATTMVPERVPLQPQPTLQELIGQALQAARLTSSPAERISLLRATMTELELSASSLPDGWVASTWTGAATALAEEERIEAAYQDLSRTVLEQATLKAAAADVRGVQGVISLLRERDTDLGSRRRAVVDGLLRAVEAKLGAARQLRLERDRWRIRRGAFRRYDKATHEIFAQLTKVQPLLDDIRVLAGADFATLGRIEQDLVRLEDRLVATNVPAELASAHTHLTSAVRFAANAIRTRQRAVSDGDLSRAWDAASAAAAALMLVDRARGEIDEILREPEL